MTLPSIDMISLRATVVPSKGTIGIKADSEQHDHGLLVERNQLHPIHVLVDLRDSAQRLHIGTAQEAIPVHGFRT